ncbi:MAG: hypothetical protein PVG39_02035 [Desulfobacteraceae bacterium]|jgi:hypothetical protein
MNYLPFCGYWFYGAASNSERAAFFGSWGLLAIAPYVGIVAAKFADYYRRIRES